MVVTLCFLHVLKKEFVVSAWLPRSTCQRFVVVTMYTIARYAYIRHSGTHLCKPRPTFYGELRLHVWNSAVCVWMKCCWNERNDTHGIFVALKNGEGNCTCICNRNCSKNVMSWWIVFIHAFGLSSAQHKSSFFSLGNTIVLGLLPMHSCTRLVSPHIHLAPRLSRTTKRGSGPFASAEHYRRPPR